MKECLSEYREDGADVT